MAPIRAARRDSDLPLIVARSRCSIVIALFIDICQYFMVSTSLLMSPVETMASCSPLSQEPLSSSAAEQIAPLLKAVADPVRLRLLSIIASHDGGEACVCDLTDCFELSQPTISHHLKVLHDVGLLNRTKRGTWVYYRAQPAALRDLAALINPVVTTSTLRNGS